MITKSKEFKRGQSEYDKMVARISKLEADLTLYKKVVERVEKQLKNEKAAMKAEYDLIATENVKLLAEVRTLKEAREQREEEVVKELDQLNTKYVEAKKVKDDMQEHMEFLQNELKLVKEVNLAFRQKNDKVQGMYYDNQRKLETLQQ
mmetsp:Transcript_42538/g.31149  ORF Transcript_42538/g.31149 Transcript_42538/m.31149 type:complete len:148 (-) Transcript_42538:818-1261(-)